MLKLMSILDRRMKARTEGDDGATMVEYGLVVTLIAVAAIATLTMVGTSVSNAFTRIAGALTPG